MTKIVLLIIASQGYQPKEYGDTRKVLEAAGYKIEVASDKGGIAFAMPSSNREKETETRDRDDSQVVVDVVLSKVNSEKYVGVFIIGGPGAVEHLNNKTMYTLMQYVAEKKKPFGAICISPRILANAGLLKGKKATGWDDDGNLEALYKQHRVVYIKEPVVVDGFYCYC